MLATSDVVRLLQKQGFEINCGYAAYILRERLVPLPRKIRGIWLWSETDVAHLRSLLRRRGRAFDADLRVAERDGTLRGADTEETVTW